jgi:hypothetical protein
VLLIDTIEIIKLMFSASLRGGMLTINVTPFLTIVSLKSTKIILQKDIVDNICIFEHKLHPRKKLLVFLIETDSPEVCGYES